MSELVYDVAAQDVVPLDYARQRGRLRPGGLTRECSVEVTA